MALTQVNSDGMKDDSIKNADIKSDAAIAKSKLAALDIVNADINASAAIAKSKLAALNIGASDITDDTITEAKLDISNTASDGQYLQYKDSSDKLTWASVSSTPEGTAILSTGESGGTKFLREDGDNSCSWQSVPAGTPTGGNSGANKIFWENEQTVTHDYTITNNHNAGTWGPVTINSSVTVTIGDGEYWTIM